MFWYTCIAKMTEKEEFSTVYSVLPGSTPAGRVDYSDYSVRLCEMVKWDYARRRNGTWDYAVEPWDYAVQPWDYAVRNGRVITQPCSSLIREWPYFEWNNDKEEHNICLSSSRVKFTSQLHERSFCIHYFWPDGLRTKSHLNPLRWIFHVDLNMNFKNKVVWWRNNCAYVWV